MATKTTTAPVVYNGKIHPPKCDTVTQLLPTSTGTKVKKLLGAFFGLVMVIGIVFAVGYCMQWKWLMYTSYVLAVLCLFSMGKSALKSHEGKCPYCSGRLGGECLDDLLLADDKKQVECPHCFEWLISNRGEVRSFQEQDVTEQTEFTCGLFGNGIWLNECVACGAPPTRHLKARSLKFNAGSLVLGRISVSSGTVKDIPYCDAHEDFVDAKIVDNKMQLAFKDFSARRRYLHFTKARIMVARNAVAESAAK